MRLQSSVEEDSPPPLDHTLVCAVLEFAKHRIIEVALPMPRQRLHRCACPDITATPLIQMTFEKGVGGEGSRRPQCRVLAGGEVPSGRKPQ
jgi:hypothetical protein